MGTVVNLPANITISKLRLILVQHGLAISQDGRGNYNIEPSTANTLLEGAPYRRGTNIKETFARVAARVREAELKEKT